MPETAPYPRHLEARLVEALADSPAVLIHGWCAPSGNPLDPRANPFSQRPCGVTVPMDVIDECVARARLR